MASFISLISFYGALAILIILSIYLDLSIRDLKKAMADWEAIGFFKEPSFSSIPSPVFITILMIALFFAIGLALIG